jgi:hypothetical protein
MPNPFKRPFLGHYQGLFLPFSSNLLKNMYENGADRARNSRVQLS